jgi:CRP-like cAMP-binding protein
LAISFAELLATRARDQGRRIEDIQVYDLSTRLARTLVALATRHAERDGDALRVSFPLTQAELAAMLGATRARVNLILGSYQDAGIIRLDRTSILVVSPRALCDRARIS